MLTIQAATAIEAGSVRRILMETAQRLNTAGSNQWGHILKGEEEANLQHHLQQEEVYVVRVEEEISGCFYLTQHASDWDQRLWGNQLETQERPYYLHKLALGNQAIGKNLGSQILTKLQLDLRKQAVPQRLRLDCLANHPYLDQFYQTNHFCYCGTVSQVMPEGDLLDFNLYEWRIV